MRSPAPNNQIDPTWQSGGFATRLICGVGQTASYIGGVADCANELYMTSRATDEN